MDPNVKPEGIGGGATEPMPTPAAGPASPQPQAPAVQPAAPVAASSVAATPSPAFVDGKGSVSPSPSATIAPTATQPAPASPAASAPVPAPASAPVSAPPTAPSTPASVQQIRKSPWASIVQRLKKYKFVVIAIVAIVLLLAGLLVRHSMQEAAWQRATEAYKSADYEKAAKELKGLPMPSDPDRLKVYAQTMLATRQLDQALEGYQKLYDAKPDPAVKLVIGNVYNEQKNTAEAVRTYQEIIASDPTYSQAYINLATLYRLQNKTAEARALVAQGVKNDPSDVALRELQVSMWLDNKASPEFKAAVDGLRKLNPDDPLLMSIGQ